MFQNNTHFGTSMGQCYGCVFYNNTWLSTGLVNAARVTDRCLFHSNSRDQRRGGCRSRIHEFRFLEQHGHIVNLCRAERRLHKLDLKLCIRQQHGRYLSCRTNKFNRLYNKIVLTADPCTAAGSGDFSLNNTAGGGALLRGLAFPVTFANGLTANSLDVGPAQHAPAAAGGFVPGPMFQMAPPPRILPCHNPPGRECGSLEACVMILEKHSITGRLSLSKSIRPPRPTSARPRLTRPTSRAATRWTVSTPRGFGTAHPTWIGAGVYWQPLAQAETVSMPIHTAGQAPRPAW